MPAMEDRASDHIAQWSERPVEIGVDERRMRDREWPEDHQRIGRYSSQQQDDVGCHAAKRDVDRMKAGRRDPVELRRGMMNRMILPHRRTMKDPMTPVHDHIGADEE